MSAHTAQNLPSEKFLHANKGYVVEVAVAIFAFLELTAVGTRLYRVWAYVHQLSPFIDPVLEPLYSFALTAAKFSICFFYLRLFVLRWVKNSVYTIMAVQTAWMVTFMVLAFAQCQPVQKIWHPEIEGTCVDQRAFVGYISLPNIFVDAALLLIPMPIVWNLQISRRRKFLLAPIFVMGAVYAPS
ncbi:MAG: hypothetical protein Q9202_000673 [Teloschistes flavicans]